MGWLKDVFKMYKIRADIELAADYMPTNNQKMADIQRVAFEDVWSTNQVWAQIPEGVGRVDFDNGIVLSRPGMETTMDEATWHLADLNVYFARVYKNKIAFTEWEPVRSRKRQ